MAVQTATVTCGPSSGGTFLFNKPAGNYGKHAGVCLTDASGPVAASFAADVDNGDGTMTGTVNLGGSVSGTVEIQIWDKP